MQSILQTKEWAKLREAQGWQAYWVEEILILKKSLPFGFSFLYSPELDFYKINFQEFLPKIKEIAKKNHSIFLRLDFINQKNAFFGQKMTNILQKNHFIKSFEEIQPEFRQIIDISKPEEQILAQMKPKGRYNIRVAQKNNIEVVIANGVTQSVQKDCHACGLAMTDSIDIFYDLFQKTAARDGFEIRPKQYFAKLIEILSKDGLAELLVARYNGIAVAAAIITFYGDTASYLYGASSDQYRNTMAPYLMHREAIKLAKAKGCRLYDLLAVEPFSSCHPEPSGEGSEILRFAQNDKNHKQQTKGHKYSGITRFKEQFGGTKIQTMGSWDLVYKPVWYKLFKWMEEIRRK